VKPVEDYRLNGQTLAAPTLLLIAPIGILVRILLVLLTRSVLSAVLRIALLRIALLLLAAALRIVLLLRLLILVGHVVSPVRAPGNKRPEEANVPTRA
jgi:hypothetical protein